jgi:hypothetical protein
MTRTVRFRKSLMIAQNLFINVVLHFIYKLLISQIDSPDNL